MNESFGEDQLEEQSDATYRTQLTSPIGSEQEEEDRFDGQEEQEDPRTSCGGGAFPNKSLQKHQSQGGMQVDNAAPSKSNLNFRQNQFNSLKMTSIREVLTEISLSKEDLAQSTSRMDSQHINDALNKGLFDDQDYSAEESNDLSSRSCLDEVGTTTNPNIRQLFQPRQSQCDCASRFVKKPESNNPANYEQYDQLIQKLNRAVIELANLKQSNEGLLAENISLLQQISHERAAHESDKESLQEQMKQLLKSKEQELLNYFKETTSQYHTRISVYETSIKNHLEHESQLQEFIENLTERNRDLETQLEAYSSHRNQQQTPPEYSYNLSAYLNNHANNPIQQRAQPSQQQQHSQHQSAATLKQPSQIQAPENNNNNNFTSLRLSNQRKSISQDQLSSFIGSFSEELESMKQKSIYPASKLFVPGNVKQQNILNENPMQVLRSKQNTPTETSRVKSTDLFRDLSQFEKETAAFAMKVMENDYSNPEITSSFDQQIKESKSLKQNYRTFSPQNNVVRQRFDSFDTGSGSNQIPNEYLDRPKSSLQIMQQYSELIVNPRTTEESHADQSFIKYNSVSYDTVANTLSSFIHTVDHNEKVNTKSYIYKSLNFNRNRNACTSLHQNDKENDRQIENRKQPNSGLSGYMKQVQQSQSSQTKMKSLNQASISNKPLKPRQLSLGKVKPQKIIIS